MSEILDKIREIRKLENPSLKSSPYLKSEYSDEYGNSNTITLRNYQKSDIMNMLIVNRHINSNDTGLGKTLVALSTLGYIWLKEPEYIPIILTKKSAIIQWATEVDKFMQQMESVVVDGQPYERHNIYNDFFLNHNPDKKRLILLTYDMLLRDMTESVVRNRDHEPTSGDKRNYADSKKNLKSVQALFDGQKEKFDIQFNDRIYDVHEYVKSQLQEKPENRETPPTWTDQDSACLSRTLEIRALLRQTKVLVEKFKNTVEPAKIVPGIEHYIDELSKNHPGARFVLIMDEMHVLKNYRGKIHEAVVNLSKKCDRLYGLTATPIKNKLMEFFSLFRILEPTLFPKVTHFMNEFCLTKLQSIGGGRKVPIVVGYKNLDEFIRRTEPYYYGRKKHDVAKELPQLITKEIVCELNDLQEELYDLAENGLMNLEEDADSGQTDILKSLTLCQQAVDSPNLIVDAETNEPYKGDSSKIDSILELLEDELDGVKTIIFSKFEQMVSVLEKELKEKSIKCVRITGKEKNVKDRENAKKIFQDMKSGVNVILITMAGSESINLQSAEHFIFIDSPWSAGDYFQLIGRMIRIGSVHTTVIASHLIAVKQSGKNTIDHHVIKTLRAKKKLIDKVAGDSLPGGLVFAKSDEMDIFNAIRADRDGITTTSKKTIASKSKNSKPVKPRNVQLSEDAMAEAANLPNISLDDL